MSTTAAAGTQTATIGTTHALASVTSQGVYALRLDVGALAAGDTLVVTRLEQVGSSGTLRATGTTTLTGVQAEGVVKSDTPDFIGSGGRIDYEIKQTAGTGRAFPWEVVKF